MAQRKEDEKQNAALISAGEKATTFPLFLSETYSEYFDRSKNVMEAAANTITSNTTREDKKKKGASRMYRAQWILDKLNQQQERRKRMRGQKVATKESSKEGEGEEKKVATGKKGKGKGVSREDQADLEQIIADLRDDLLWKDEELRDMRDEFEAMKITVDRLHKENKIEKAQRQILEANKLKYVMMGELLDYKG